MSAVRTGPQVKPSRNCAHSATGAPVALLCCGSDTVVSALARTRKPLEPVSTSTPSIVWHDDWPGTQIVTVVKAPLK